MVRGGHLERKVGTMFDLRNALRAATFTAVLSLLLASAALAGPPYSCSNLPPPRIVPFSGDKFYPNGADDLYCTQQGNTETWIIWYPYISQELTEYPDIQFHRGDVVRFDAVGCAQTGGSGKTWKQYAVPVKDDHDFDTRYYAILQVEGLTGKDEKQSLYHWMGGQYVILRESHLTLGYVDDDYTDNGYWEHDDGVQDQCKNSFDNRVVVTIERQAQAFGDCPTSAGSAPAVAGVVEFNRVAHLLRSDDNGVEVGLPATPDQTGPDLVHFQIFQEGDPASQTVFTRFPANSLEMHQDGCIDIAVTPSRGPTWYPVDLAFDNNDPDKSEEKRPFKRFLARPWDPFKADVTFARLEDENRTPPLWGNNAAKGECGGAGTLWRAAAPRWIHLCPAGQTPPPLWRADDLLGFPVGIPEGTGGMGDSGNLCGHKIKGFSATDGCTDVFAPEFMAANDSPEIQGIVTNSFLSGGDYSGDHNNRPNGAYPGRFWDLEIHNVGVPNCAFGETRNGDLCADWEINLLPDPHQRGVLANDESMFVTELEKEGDCFRNHMDKFRKGNWVSDLKGALGVETEQWTLPVGYRPEPGDRALVRGHKIIDCGHPNWQTEIHPPELVISSYLQVGNYAPTLGATWDRPPQTDSWQFLTRGAPATVTKVVLTPYWEGPETEFDIFPPARPNTTARMRFAGGPDLQNLSGAEIVSETPLPVGNPNHLHVKVRRLAPYTAHFGGNGEIDNPDTNLKFWASYMLWWEELR